MIHSSSFFEVLVPVLTAMLSVITTGAFIYSQDNGLTSGFLCLFLGKRSDPLPPLLT